MKPILILKGGLGNQLFQWYFAHGISEKFTYAFLSNDSKKTGGGAERNLNPKIRDFELDLLQDICRHGVEPSEKFGYDLLYRNTAKLAAKLWDSSLFRQSIHNLGYLRDDPRQNVDSSKKSPKRIRVADGYFQSNDYVEKVWIHVSIELQNVLIGVFENLRKRLFIPDSFQVIHVRRPDEKHHLRSPLNLGALDNFYFKNASNVIPNANRILLISDKTDLGETYKFISPSYVFDSTETTAWEALAIMTFAENLVGSNSTLSWWGARMCRANGGDAYLPEEWSKSGIFDSQELDFGGLHRLPSSWISDLESGY
jgi:hypothetical protein